MSSSRLLNELSLIRDNMFISNISHDCSYNVNGYMSPPIYIGMCLENIFGCIKKHLDKEHVETCEVCHGISIAMKDRRSKNSTFYLCCSCGAEWSFPGVYLTYRYHNMDIEDLLMHINMEIRNSNKDRGIFEKFIETDNKKHDTPSKYKSAIMSLEIL